MSSVSSSSTDDIAHLSESLLKLTSLLEQHSGIVNVCMVDFITEDIFTKCIGDQLQDDLLRLSEEDICNMPDLLLNQDELGW